MLSGMTHALCCLHSSVQGACGVNTVHWSLCSEGRGGRAEATPRSFHGEPATPCLVSGAAHLMSTGK